MRKTNIKSNKDNKDNNILKDSNNKEDRYNNKIFNNSLQLEINNHP